MNGKILVELSDLLQAERELSVLLGKLRTDEQEARALYRRLDGWIGQSADSVRQQIEAFFAGLDTRINSIEQQKTELLRYVEVMRQADEMR
ncbi:hypothetical protein Q5741_14670 [Paenibacillus sp. JX-17]|uniref:WXG100 family type VII secretion target n=1 Tax=Paenibacillus lacisoli TaxID=3064525 RepID=A0ABT9CEK7_9BACL|nr:hypothetical protein [Paenibacillus sp. JX-17]MDO7907651.1 hypothetical protein [Paenibacillus sp. JX-17]